MAIVTQTKTALRNIKKANSKNNRCVKFQAAITTYLAVPQVPSELVTTAAAAATAVTNLQTALEAWIAANNL